MDIHTYAYVKLLLSPRQSRGISYWIKNKELKENCFQFQKM